MSIRLKLVTAPIGALVIAAMFGVTPGLAQTTDGAAAQGHQSGRGGAAPGTILGPAMLNPRMADLACGTGPAGLAEWGIDRIEQSLTLTDNQRNKFNDLKGASEKAVKFLQESCPTNDPTFTPTGRLEAMRAAGEIGGDAVVALRRHDSGGPVAEAQAAAAVTHFAEVVVLVLVDPGMHVSGLHDDVTAGGLEILPVKRRGRVVCVGVGDSRHGLE